jgi:hypothetical protein
MFTSRLLVLSGISIAGISGAMAPAHATLQIAIEAGVTTFFCADNQACDTNPTVGVLDIANQTIGGVRINGSIQQSQQGATDFLSTSSLSLINGTGASINASVAIGDIGFIGPVSSISLSGAGTYLAARGSSITMEWLADPANAQGADNVADLPGTVLDTFPFTSTRRADAFSHASDVPFSASGPFSMTLFATGTLTAGGSLINRGQTEIAAVVPEPATWAMMVVGFASLGLTAFQRRRRGSAPA